MHPGDTQAAVALEVEGLTVTYGPITALKNVNLRVREGCVCGLVGMNGSGKSTLFKAVMGLVPAQSGTITLCGTNSLAARKAGWVGYVPQSEAIDLSFPLRVRDVVMQGRYGFMGPMRRPKQADRDAVEAALETVGLRTLSSRGIGDLSGGQRKRVFVARALAQGAKLLILDEPFAGVDRTSEGTISELLRALAADGVAVVVSTHGLGSVPDLCDEVALLNRTIMFQGDPHEAMRPDMLDRAFASPEEDDE